MGWLRAASHLPSRMTGAPTVSAAIAAAAVLVVLLARIPRRPASPPSSVSAWR